eukprot:CAMPEP_0185778616 /NCGR_PEP_ID=MMETSP1174-20130828/93037_1 /TAXON_ID=35687 /ORGANISM="Dictyocha speculum, Strain CCMP1381" /LENGTH=268 /DNA_ID=CAMNT_0028467405 /DNA_START=226 /DNA_END=1028 /DNA_ORIENTATION=+
MMPWNPHVEDWGVKIKFLACPDDSVDILVGDDGSGGSMAVVKRGEGSKAAIGSMGPQIQSLVRSVESGLKSRLEHDLRARFPHSRVESVQGNHGDNLADLKKAVGSRKKREAEEREIVDSTLSSQREPRGDSDVIDVEWKPVPPPSSAHAGEDTASASSVVEDGGENDSPRRPQRPSLEDNLELDDDIMELVNAVAGGTLDKSGEQSFVKALRQSADESNISEAALAEMLAKGAGLAQDRGSDLAVMDSMDFLDEGLVQLQVSFDEMA